MTSRLGTRKVEFLARGVAQIRKGQKILELFGGTNLSTYVISNILGNNRFITLDLGYKSGISGFQKVCGDARALPFPDNFFDVVLAIDSPRTAYNRFGGTAGRECGLTPKEQEELFRDTFLESFRVLRYGGVFAATTVRSWIYGLPLKIISPTSRMLQFKMVNDPVVYVRGQKCTG